jgi:DNA-binding NarL/FixJ family response regulator
MSTVAPLIDLARPLRREFIGPTLTGATAVHVAHSDPVVSAGLVAILTGTRDFRVTGADRAASPSPGSDLAEVDVVVADYTSALRLIEVTPELSQRMLILTDSDSQAKIRHALERGVRGYLLLGCSLAELLHGIRVVRNGGVALDPVAACRIAETMNQPALTHREQAILNQMMLGLSNKRIALGQGVAVGTVKTHVKSILAKLKVASRTQAVIIARRRGLVEECDAHWQQPLRAEDPRSPSNPPGE